MEYPLSASNIEACEKPCARSVVVAPAPVAFQPATVIATSRLDQPTALRLASVTVSVPSPTEAIASMAPAVA